MTLGDAPRMFSRVITFFPSSVIFYLTQNSGGNFSACALGYLLFMKKLKEKWIQFLNILFLVQAGKS